MKKWYTSKTLWVNFLALAGVVVQGITGTEWLTPETQGVILTVINMVLRFATKQEINWKGEDAQ